MRSSSLKVGLLSALIACAAFTAAKAQEDDKSYLPPKTFQGKAEPALPAKSASAPHQYARQAPAAQPRAHAAAVQPQRKRIRVAHRRHYERFAYNRGGFPFFFGFFN